MTISSSKNQAACHGCGYHFKPEGVQTFLARLIVGLGIVFMFWSGTIFLLCAEVFFFDEFKSRFNTVAVDYLLYPHEVFINIWDSYPVAWVLAGCVAAGLGWTMMVARLGRGMWEQAV